MAAPRICCCDAMCWVKIRQCCGPFEDQVYVSCANAAAAGIPETGAFLWLENCWEVETVVGTPPPAGSIIVGAEIIGAIRATYDHCAAEFPGDPDACCQSRVSGCWYVVQRCCQIQQPSCDDDLFPPDIVYIDCTDVDPFVAPAGSIVFPYVFKPTSLAPTLPESCVACYVMDGTKVDELPPDATVLGSILGLPSFGTCEAMECCPDVTGVTCPLPCSTPTYIIWSISVPAENAFGCPCDLPLTPQAWKIGNYQSTLSCDAQSAVSVNGCKLTYLTTLACNIVLNGQGQPSTIFYRASLNFANAAKIGPNDPDCVVCGYTFPGFQPCADPCNVSHTVILRTPDLPLGTCPLGAQFTIVETKLNINGTPTILGFV